MGSYITTSVIYNDVMSRITSTTVSASILTLYIADAEAEINSYVAKQYTVATVVAAQPPLLTKLAKDLTVYNVLRDSYTQDNQNASEWLEGKKTAADELLKKIGEGDVRLVASNTVLATNVNMNMGSSTLNIPLITNMDDEYSWAEPQNLLDKIDTDRETAG